MRRRPRANAFEVESHARDSAEPYRSARRESSLMNPYIAPRYSEVSRDISGGHGPSLLALLAASTFGAFIALALGMTTCWLRGGWLNQQFQLPIEHWQLPIYFWFHCGVWCVNALVLSILGLPMYLYLRRSFNVLRLMCLVFAFSASVTIGFEAFKTYEMIEPPTHALIVLLSSSALLLPLCLIQLLNLRTRHVLKI